MTTMMISISGQRSSLKTRSTTSSQLEVCFLQSRGTASSVMARDILGHEGEGLPQYGGGSPNIAHPQPKKL